MNFFNSVLAKCFLVTSFGINKWGDDTRIVSSPHFRRVAKDFETDFKRGELIKNSD